MTIYGIADLHLDSTGEKPMGIFGEKWLNHEDKIINNWIQTVKDEDLVLIPGDISWALKLNGAYEDLKRIDELPGTKIITKGNHDYWWETKSKLSSLDLKTIHFIYNDSIVQKDIGIGGTRGWTSKDSNEFSEQDEKIFNRELNRLKTSLSSIKEPVNKKIAMIHYPPFNANGSTNEFVDVMKEEAVSICVYGHLHAEGHKYIVEGEIDGIQFYCIACDYIDFKPVVLL